MRIVLADDHPFIRSGVAHILQINGFTIEALVSDGQEALVAIEKHHPDIAVLDVTMPVLDGIAVLQRLRETGDETPVVLLTAALDDKQVFHAMQFDVRGIVFKDGAEDCLIDCLKDVAAGRRYIDQHLLERALAHSLKSKRDPLGLLAPREREIATRVSEGMRNREIGDAMNITEGTVKVYLNAIYTKLGIRNRTALALLVTAQNQ